MNYSRMMVALMATGMLHTGIQAAEVNGTLKDQSAKHGYSNQDR